MSERGAPIIYGLEAQGRALTARALAARAGETEKIQFLCGTQSLRQENQLHLLEYDDDLGVLDKSVFLHPAGEIWHLSAAPFDSDLVCTCYGQSHHLDEEGHPPTSGGVSGGGVTAGLWRLGEEGGELVKVATLTQPGNTRCTAWHPGSSPQVVAIDDKQVSLWKLAGDTVKSLATVELDSKTHSTYSSLSWNPHHNCSTVLCSVDNAIRCWDIRTNKFVSCVEQPHGPCVRGVDHNPNKPHCFASCGDDCCVKFWDSRKLSQPLATRQEHSHWVWSVQYNLFHDQLILSASSDSQVVLTRMASIASEPLQHIDDDETISRPPPIDERIQTFEEHEDSVYSAVWSVADAWVFASLSYDGRLVVNHVPSQEKFSILTS